MEDVFQPRLLRISPSFVDRKLQERGRESSLGSHREQACPAMHECRPNRLAQRS